jgi:redox-sensitive bicupin YhaK (pirin superfamily)
MENTVINKSEQRLHVNHGFVDSYFTFNQRDNPGSGFGALFALNDDTVNAGQGFGMHPHSNMEIITIPLAGELEHKDTIGSVGLTKKGDVQVMSAGTRIAHSEYNHSKENPLRLLEIWIVPNKQNVQQRYGQISISEGDYHNKLAQVVSPNEQEQATWIHQNAWFYLGKFDGGKATTYNLKGNGNGVYTHVISGTLKINGNEMKLGDGIGILNVSTIQYEFSSEAEILVIEVPMLSAQ